MQLKSRRLRTSGASRTPKILTRGGAMGLLLAAANAGVYLIGDSNVSGIDQVNSTDPIRLTPTTFNELVQACRYIVQGSSAPLLDLQKYPDSNAVNADQDLTVTGVGFGFELEYSGPVNTFPRGVITAQVKDGATVVYTFRAHFRGPGKVRGLFVNNSGGLANPAKFSGNPTITIVAASSSVAIGDLITLRVFNQRDIANTTENPAI